MLFKMGTLLESHTHPLGQFHGIKVAMKWLGF